MSLETAPLCKAAARNIWRGSFPVFLNLELWFVDICDICAVGGHSITTFYLFALQQGCVEI